MRPSRENIWKQTMVIIQWLNDGVLEVTGCFQIEAIRHSEKK